MKTMHLFAGAGGGILADLILGHEPVVAVEWEPYACQVLRERVAEGWFPGLQVWEGDVRLFDPSEYKGKVDCIHAGFPCQDISCAGNQAGVGEGTRSGLYREVLRIADEVRPGFIFLENVAAIVTSDVGRMLRTVAGDLAKRGYDAVWKCLSASEVGASHKRDRWWLLAYPARQPSYECESFGKASKSRISESRDSDRQNNILADSISGESQKRGNLSRVGRAGKQVEGDAVSWHEDQPTLVGVANDVPHRMDRIRCLGNAQVPLQAATAFSILWKMMEAANE